MVCPDRCVQKGMYSSMMSPRAYGQGGSRRGISIVPYHLHRPCIQWLDAAADGDGLSCGYHHQRMEGFRRRQTDWSSIWFYDLLCNKTGQTQRYEDTPMTAATSIEVLRPRRPFLLSTQDRCSFLLSMVCLRSKRFQCTRLPVD